MITMQIKASRDEFRAIADAIEHGTDHVDERFEDKLQRLANRLRDLAEPQQPKRAN